MDLFGLTQTERCDRVMGMWLVVILPVGALIVGSLIGYALYKADIDLNMNMSDAEFLLFFGQG